MRSRLVYRGFTDVGQGPITAKCSVYCPAAYYNTSQTFGNTSAPSATSGRRCPFLKDLRVVLASAVSTVRLEAVTNMGQTDAYHRELCRAVKMTHTHNDTHSLNSSIRLSVCLSNYLTMCPRPLSTPFFSQLRCSGGSAALQQPEARGRPRRLGSRLGTRPGKGSGDQERTWRFMGNKWGYTSGP